MKQVSLCFVVGRLKRGGLFETFAMCVAYIKATVSTIHHCYRACQPTAGFSPNFYKIKLINRGVTCRQHNDTFLNLQNKCTTRVDNDTF